MEAGGDDGATAAMTAAVGRRTRLADNERWLWRLMLAPAILYIVLLVGFPFFLSLYYSVSNVTVGSRDMAFVGLENFRRMIDSHTFWTALQEHVDLHDRLAVLRTRVRQHAGDGAVDRFPRQVGGAAS